MPNWLSATGRAAPEINAINREFEEIPRRRATFNQQMVRGGQDIQMNEMQLNKMKAEENERIEKEKFLSSGWDPSVEPALSWLPAERKQFYIGMMKKNGLINPETGVGTQRSRIMAIQSLATSSQLAGMIGEDRKQWSLSQINTIDEELGRLQEKDNPDQEKLNTLQTKRNALVKQHNMLVGDVEKATNMGSMAEVIQGLGKAGELQRMPVQTRIALLSAHKTGNLTEFNRSLEIWQREKETAKREPRTEVEVLALPDDDPRKIAYIKSKKGFRTQKPETKTEFDKKWAISEKIAAKRKGSTPTDEEVATAFKANFGSSDFLTALLGGSLPGKESSSGYTFDPNKGLIPKK